MKSFIFIVSLCCLFSCKEDEGAYDLRQNANFDSIKIPLEYLDVVDSQANLNYVRTLLFTWKLTFENPYFKKYNCTGCEPRAWDNFGRYSQALSSVSDYKNAIQYSMRLDQAGPDTVGKADLKTYDPIPYLLEKFKENNIIMFNEAHDRAQCRAYVLSLLPYLKKAGATHLALEMLYSKENIRELDIKTGLFTNEPTAGQLVREALKLGFTLVSYEDTIRVSSVNERERYQSRNLFNKIKNNSGIHKTILLGGYGHTSEYLSDTTVFKPMAMYFKELSGIDPITVNLIELTESSPAGDFHRDMIEAKVRTKIDTVKLIKTDELDSFCSKFYGEITEKRDHYDFYIYHPNVKYTHNKPTWLITSKEKEFISIEIPNDIKPVLIQAYVANEIKTDKDYNTRIPYDQTFMSENGKAWFVSKKGEKYIIIFRDENNKIILKKEI